MHQQVSMSLLHMCKVFHTWRGKQMIMTSLDDVIVIMLMKKVGGYKRNAQASGLLLRFLVVAHSVTLCEEPQTLSCSYLGASWGVRLQLYRELFFICSSVSAQGYLGHPELVHLSCLWVNQVSCHPASLGPGIRVVRTAIFQCQLVHTG